VSVCVLIFCLLCVAVCSTSLVCAVRSVSKTLARELIIPVLLRILLLLLVVLKGSNTTTTTNIKLSARAAMGHARPKPGGQRNQVRAKNHHASTTMNTATTTSTTQGFEYYYYY